jgi:hypothetical protein
MDGFLSPVVWERPERAPADWKVPRQEVDDAIAEAMETFEVLELACDPPGWHSEIEVWREKYGPVVVDIPTNERRRMAAACDRFRTAVLEGELSHDGSPVLARHIGHTIAKETAYGTIVTKEHPDAPRKIDAAVAAIVAYERAAYHASVGDVSWGVRVTKRKAYWKTKVPATGEPAAKRGRDWFFTGGDSDLRDVSKPVGFDEKGSPLYAPRGIVTRWP